MIITKYKKSQTQNIIMSRSNSTEKSNKSERKRTPLGIIISFQLGNLVWFMINQGFRMRILGYNENVMNLNSVLFLVAFAIFTVYNMFNDPSSVISAINQLVWLKGGGNDFLSF